MCGIMGYVGPRPATPILLEGLARLEYRGYDSAGIAVVDDGAIGVRKSAGKLAKLVDLVASQPVDGRAGIGHTRWATHGPPTDGNAHPHTDPDGEFAVVHNGIIENFLELREELAGSGHAFSSDTDTEVLAHLVALSYDGDLTAAVRAAVERARGAYALVVMSTREPDTIVAARMISPLVIGLAQGETLLASDIPALLPHTRTIMIIEDGEVATITPDGVTVQSLEGSSVERDPFEVEWDAEQAERAGYPHFMLKEIYEQPAVIGETLAGRLDADGEVELDGVAIPDELAVGFDRLWITGCGTAYHAGLVAKEFFERQLRLPTEVVYAHEVRYRDPLIGPESLTLAISQSGETADTLAAARLARQLGSRVITLTNAIGSTVAREADDVLNLRAGPEIAVASTKAYLAMLMGSYLLGMHLGKARGTLTAEAAADLASGLGALPVKAEQVLKDGEAVAELAVELAEARDVYFIGRGLDFAVATEGSLKMKEISYVHSEAMPAGELKHGTLALVTQGTPVVAVVTQAHVYDKTISAVQEVKARQAHVVAVAYEDDEEIALHADDVIRIPRTHDALSPVLAAIPLQLLAYHIARLRGHDIDQPRNLAKSVTVE